MINADNLLRDFSRVREVSPLIHNITNFVVMNSTANALLALGASPVMAHALEEVNDMVNIASALVINMGTLSEKWVEAMLMAGESAGKAGKAVVFDPVGAGATPYRNSTASLILERCRPAIIRGNASEIMSLAENTSSTKGVDSTLSSDSVRKPMEKLALDTGSVVVVSGETDIITDGNRMNTIRNGSDMMPGVTGMGCTATALIGAFASVNHDYFEAASHAMAVMGVTGELAAEKAQGPGSLQMHFIDELYNLAGEKVIEMLRE